MKTLILLLAVLLPACASTGASAGGKSASQRGADIAVDPFPAPTAGITLRIDATKPPTIEDLVSQLEKVTGVHFMISQEVSRTLEKTPTGLTHTLEIPREQVWTVAETILVENGFALTFANQDEPKMMSVSSIMGNRQGIRSTAHFVPREELRAWARHPAFLVTTMLVLDATDVRTLSNSMRTMFTDANTQQIIPVGNSNSLIMTGFPNNLASLADMLDHCNDAERKRLAEEAKKVPPPRRAPGETPQPTPK